jgi:HPt (histidine-containing phosphotransfer) domain-containing protein
VSFDRESFMSLIEGDKELFSSLLSLFEDDWPKLIFKIRAGLKEKKAKPVEEAAHRLKGSLRNFYANEAALLAQQIESAGKSNSLDHLDGVVEELNSRLAKIQSDLHQFLKEMS